MAGNLMSLLLILLITFITVPVSGNFVLTVKFINYTNPTGLCAECETRLENVTSVDPLTPVCCDESPFRSDNCNNTGEARCDTRFRWTIRPFGASLETRPNSPYCYTNCTLPGATCPFSEMSTTFRQGLTGFLKVEANPLPVEPKPNTFTSWPGRVQFFIEAVDSGLPNIIDSLLINLDNLQLGADFTEEMTFTGYHNISHMTMSFRVTCVNGFCERDCTATKTNNPRILLCNSTDGDIVCKEKYDPSANCNKCLYNLNFSTDCSVCLKPNFDSVTNCTACLPGYDRNMNCSTCLNTNYDPSANCTTCLPSYDPVTNCTTCLDSLFDPDNDCTSCLLEGHDPLTNCTTCLTSYEGENCTPDSSLSAAFVGGVAGGVGGSLLLVIIVLVVTVGVLVYQVRRRGHAKFNVSEKAVTNAYLEGGGTGTGSSVELKFENPIYGPGQELDSKPGTKKANEVLPPVSEKTRHPSKSRAPYEEIDKDLNLPGWSAPPGVYDKAYNPTPSGNDPLANAYSELEEPANVYSTIDGPTNTYSAPEGPAEDYSELSHPAKAITRPGNKSMFNSNYSNLIDGHTADEELPTHDVSIHSHPQTQPQTLPPHAAALYNTVNYPNEPTRQHDYAETADFFGPTLDSSPSNSIKSRPYDYVDTPLDSESGSSSVPPAVDPRVRAVYTNTMPGKVTPEAEYHYDLGQ